MNLLRVAAPAVLITTLALSSAPAARAATLGSDRPKAQSVTTVGTLRVERYGSGSPALIFVPGLASGSWVWDATVPVFAPKHAVYVVTLAGFDGLAAPSGPLLDKADDSLQQLIAKERLDRPVIIGHSLGGFLALRFGTEHPDLVRGIVSVDGTPVYPPLAQGTAQERAAAAAGIATQMKNSTPEQFKTGQAQTIATMVTDPAKASQVATLSARSDPAATATYAQELFEADLRPELAKLTVPTLEIVPVPTTPMPYEGPQTASSTIEQRAAGYKQFYSALFSGAPNVQFVTVLNSRHFVMVDQPKALDDAIAAFLAGLKG